jgi:hypothetical protein
MRTCNRETKHIGHSFGKGEARNTAIEVPK